MHIELPFELLLLVFFFCSCCWFLLLNILLSPVMWKYRNVSYYIKLELLPAWKCWDALVYKNTTLHPPPSILHMAFWDFGAPLNHRYGLSTPVWLWSHSPGIPWYTSTPSPDYRPFHSDYIFLCEWLWNYSGVEASNQTGNWEFKLTLLDELLRSLQVRMKWLLDVKFPLCHTLHILDFPFEIPSKFLLTSLKECDIYINI